MLQRTSDGHRGRGTQSRRAWLVVGLLLATCLAAGAPARAVDTASRGAPAPAARRPPAGTVPAERSSGKPAGTAEEPRPEENAAAAATAASPRASQAVLDTCSGCHEGLPDERLRRPALSHAQSVHRDPRIGCVGCHGGDAEDPTARAHAPASGFVAKPSGWALAERCATCHADVVFVRSLNPTLQVDQRALFAHAVHGSLLRAGDARAPTCATCHGAHDIAPASSPESRVHRSHVAETCAGCHAHAARMGAAHLPTDQLQDWKRGAHGQAFAHDLTRAPTCSDCHSAHAEAPAVGKTADAACGHCHQEALRSFEASPHSRAFARLGLARCTPCHTAHDVERGTLLLGTGQGSSCGRCHARDERPRAVAAALSTALRSVDERLGGGRAALATAQGAGGASPPGAAAALAAMQQARLALSRALHTLDPTRANAPERAAVAAADHALALARAARSPHQETRRGYVAALLVAALWGLLLGAKALVAAHRRRRERRAAATASPSAEHRAAAAAETSSDSNASSASGASRSSGASSDSGEDDGEDGDDDDDDDDGEDDGEDDGSGGKGDGGPQG